MGRSFEAFARTGNVVVMAGAGVSAGRPSALPGWKATNAAIIEVLCRFLESSTNRPGWASQLSPAIDAERGADRFPPDYQAQIIEEVCGDRYFRALQAFDVDVINASHDSIAALAAAGAVRAVVTTNFDRLIEQALSKRGVQYRVARDNLEYSDMQQFLSAGRRDPLPILKIHGCVSDHRSMIDTLKQRKLGRSRHLQACLDALQESYWLYLGFSAADLETDPDYLGLIAGAARSAGATYVAYPADPVLGDGAKRLMGAFGNRGEIIPAYIATFVEEACRSLGKRVPDRDFCEAALGLAQFQQKLEDWAFGLSPAAAGTCLAAILEAIGQAEPAVRILDRLVRKELQREKDTADFRVLQLHYGRLGSAWGRFVAVPDLGGAASNASVETRQSLLRLLDSELGFAAASWLACSELWLSDGQRATEMADALIDGVLPSQFEGAQPRKEEEALDAWLSAAQVFIINSHSHTINRILSTSDAALACAKRSGDVVRMARVAALQCLALAVAAKEVPALLAQYEAIFKDAARVGDGFALGMRALALGRWFVGARGLALARTTDHKTVAHRALKSIAEAVHCFRNQGMHPWELFALVQQAKAYSDLRQIDKAQACIDGVGKGLERFPSLASHVFEAVGQIRTMLRDEDATQSFETALEAAEKCGLLFRREMLLSTYLQ